MKAKKVSILVASPVLAPYYKRTLEKLNLWESYNIEKREHLDYYFKRLPDGRIDLTTYLHAFYTLLSKNLCKKVRILGIDWENTKVIEGIRILLFKGEPVNYESIEPGSVIVLDVEGECTGEAVTNLGKMKKEGYGRVMVKVLE